MRNVAGGISLFPLAVLFISSLPSLQLTVLALPYPGVKLGLLFLPGLPCPARRTPVQVTLCVRGAAPSQGAGCCFCRISPRCDRGEHPLAWFPVVVTGACLVLAYGLSRPSSKPARGCEWALWPAWEPICSDLSGPFVVCVMVLGARVPAAGRPLPCSALWRPAQPGTPVAVLVGQSASPSH